MNKSKRRLWPFRPQVSVILTFVILIALFLIFAILRATVGWPGDEYQKEVFIGILLLSLLPVLLALLDVVIERGGVFKFAGVEIDFSKVPQLGISGITVPANIGVRGEPISDSYTTQILDALNQATSCDIIIIDLEEGQAWWETRLFVLLAGAVRLKRPDKIVFVATDAGKQQCFQGWAHPDELLRVLKLAHPQFQRSLQASLAAAKQWDLVEPVNPADPNQPVSKPASHSWMQIGLAAQHPWMAFEDNSGLRNELFAEQLLATDLGEKIEMKEGSNSISIVRLDDLFRPVLKKDSIDRSWSSELQLKTFFESDSDAEYIAVNQDGRYSTLISKLTVLNEILKTLVKERQRK